MYKELISVVIPVVIVAFWVVVLLLAVFGLVYCLKQLGQISMIKLEAEILLSTNRSNVVVEYNIFSSLLIAVIISDK